MPTKKELCEMWNRSPERQIAVLQAKILEAFIKTDGNIAIAWSGGKDSSYLVYKAAQIWVQMPYWIKKKKPLMVCFADTTNEHKLTRKYIKTFLPNGKLSVSRKGKPLKSLRITYKLS